VAAITPFTPVTPFTIVRSAVGTSQTDWILKPVWANKAIVFLSVTAAGTSSIMTFLAADPALRDDAQVLTLFTGATITAASNHMYPIGDFGISSAEVADGAAADAIVLQDELRAIPAYLGLQMTTVGGPTYTLSIEFRR
jgi:hypothetical protein